MVKVVVEVDFQTADDYSDFCRQVVDSGLSQEDYLLKLIEDRIKARDRGADHDNVG